jgi:hypothetical protein
MSTGRELKRIAGRYVKARRPPVWSDYRAAPVHPNGVAARVRRIQREIERGRMDDE